MTTRSFLVFLLAAPLLTSCINQRAIDTLNARVTQNEQRMQQLSSQVGNVEQVLPGQAEMWAQMQAMRQELNMARGQLDELNASGGAALSGNLDARVNRLEAAMRQMGSQLGIQMEILDAPLEPATPGTPVPDGSPVQPAPGATPVATPTPPADGAPDTATALYDSGMSAFASRNYTGAVKAFTDFTTAFPKHKLVSNAHFWRGESYYQLKDYGGAALAYNDVIEKFSGSAKFQSAMLKQGMAFHYAGKKDAAKIRLNELIKRYPSSPEAGRAKKFMEQNT